MIKDKIRIKKERRLRVKKRIRKKIFGTAERPRLTIYKSNRYLYVQAVDDESGRTIAFASTLEKSFEEFGKNRKNLKAAEKLGELIAQRLKEKGIERVVFDRNGYPYHGKLKALADAARKAGLKF
ncbi:MAG: 50S ribosomal protein L18 [Candidatus Aminicenantes bacterium]|nr:50S ribosomal protein L18 [Candidatus Aminicenantes bacterium]